MPYINTTTNVKVSSESEEAIKTQFGKAIRIFGKSEDWLMLHFSDDQRMYFHGDNSQPMAMVEVELFGRATESAYSQMTATITEIVSKELNIAPNQVYVKYEEISTWGWNGNNF